MDRRAARGLHGSCPVHQKNFGDYTIPGISPSQVRNYWYHQARKQKRKGMGMVAKAKEEEYDEEEEDEEEEDEEYSD
jgi:hypothetical protein